MFPTGLDTGGLFERFQQSRLLPHQNEAAAEVAAACLARRRSRLEQVDLAPIVLAGTPRKWDHDGPLRVLLDPVENSVISMC